MLLLALAVAVGSMHGTITFEGYPLPGVTVKVMSGSFFASRIANATGSYAFDEVPPGSYDLTFELTGFATEKRIASVDAGNSAQTDVDMKAVRSVTITIACGPRCVDVPKSAWDSPACKDFELDDALIVNAQHGDRSAIDLLVRRYADELTYWERYRIAGALLGRVADDRAIWNELITHAENEVEFTGHPDKLDAYCASQAYDTEAYDAAAWQALFAVSGDRRSRPLLLRALASDRSELIDIATLGFAIQHDETALPQIDEALQRSSGSASLLAFFHTDAADRVAMKYLNENDRDDYEETRREAEAAGNSASASSPPP